MLCHYYYSIYILYHLPDIRLGHMAQQTHAHALLQHMELADLVDLVNGKFHSISTGKMWKWNGMEWKFSIVESISTYICFHVRFTWYIPGTVYVMVPGNRQTTTMSRVCGVVS